ncbi:MAG: LytTR family DNA-binding domain-containing protein [Bacteroidales bacterium]|nr:LytTR family DNA-binding domain-containing protein [Bacteroidales bacterium]
MDKLRVCVIDDEPIANQLICSYVERTPFLELVGSYASAQDAVKAILTEDVDLVFMDIQMPQLNGMEFSKIMPAHTKVIFTTAFDQYAIQAFKVGALDYLLKPISYEEFFTSANRALASTQSARNPAATTSRRNHLIVKSEYKLIQIPFDEILFVEGLKDYVKIYLTQDQKSIMTLMSMRLLECYLPSNMFMRIHRSYIVNLNHVRLIERNRVVFGTHNLPISESYKQQFQDYILARTVAGTGIEEE